MPQQDLSGRTIDEQDAAIEQCLKYRERKSTLKTIYPGSYFLISVSAREEDALDMIDTGSKQRDFIMKKMKLRPKIIIPAGEEGKAFQGDLNVFMKIVFVTGTEHMSKETYEALMAERKPQAAITEADKKPSKKTKELQKVAKDLLDEAGSIEKAKGIVQDLKEHFGDENVKVKGELKDTEEEPLYIG